jgi:trans-2,3-dihydro-3-hydroxyanthranilate isomerase
MAALRFVLCDVFTDTALTGNALAVFTRATDLPQDRMQAIAREMNLSETVFVMPPAAGGHAKIRIFTPTTEMPFAGHPVLGTAVVLGGALQAEVVRLETGRGIIAVQLERDGARIVFGWMRQPIPERAPFAQAEELLDVLGAKRSLLPVEVYDNGPRHVMVSLESREAVARVSPDFKALARLTDAGVSTFAGEAGTYKTRMFAPGHGVDEDPATGSAAGPLAWHLVLHGRESVGTTLRIEQGTEIGRPSTLYARVEGPVEHPSALVVGGAAVVVGRGELSL